MKTSVLRQLLEMIEANAVRLRAKYRHIPRDLVGHGGRRVVSYIIYICGLSFGVVLSASLGWSASAKPLLLLSDCLKMAVKPDQIELVLAAPDPVTLPDGRQTYTISLSVNGRSFGLCYENSASRDAAYATISEALQE